MFTFDVNTINDCLWLTIVYKCDYILQQLVMEECLVTQIE